MTGSADTASEGLDPAAVAAAVRALLAEETARVDDPRPTPEDRTGWHAYRPIEPDGAGRRVFEPESWRWFDLVDVGLVDGLVLVVFRWTDPATPDLRYCCLLHADGLPSAAAAAVIVRGQLRRLLEPGWCDRVDRTWLSQGTVLVRRDRDRDRPSADRARRVLQELRDAAWTTPRGLASD